MLAWMTVRLCYQEAGTLEVRWCSVKKCLTYFTSIEILILTKGYWYPDFLAEYFILPIYVMYFITASSIVVYSMHKKISIQIIIGIANLILNQTCSVFKATQIIITVYSRDNKSLLQSIQGITNHYCEHDKPRPCVFIRVSVTSIFNINIITSSRVLTTAV